jgi:hypothetical protein
VLVKAASYGEEEREREATRRTTFGLKTGGGGVTVGAL